MMGNWRQFFVAIVLVTVCPGVSSSSAEEAPSGIDPSLVIEEFDVFNDGDFLLVPVKAFGRTRTFAIDTGCSCTIYDVSLRHFLETPLESIRVSSPGGPVSVELFHSPQAHLGSISLRTDTEVICHDLTRINQILGLTRIEGFIGMPTLKQFVVRLDFDSGKLLFLKAVPENAGTPIQMSQWRGIPTVQVELEGHGGEEFLIDTGLISENGGSLSSDVVTKLEAQGLVTVSETKSVGIDLSGDYKKKHLYIKGLRVGPYRMLDVAMPEQRGPNMLGLGFLSRFNVTFDFPNHQLYLQTCKHFNRPFKGSLGGVLFVRKNNEMVVKDVRKDSPADKSGIRLGDVLLQVGSRDARTTRPFLLWQEFGVPETIVHVKLRRGDEIIDVDVKLPKRTHVTRFEVSTSPDVERTAEATEGTRR